MGPQETTCEILDQGAIMKKRNTIMAFLAGVSAAVAVLSLSGQLDLSDTVRADVTKKEATKPYTPTLEEWVTVWLRTSIGSPTVTVTWHVTDRGVRWEIQASHKKTDKKAAFLWIYQKEHIQDMVEIWKKRRQDIAMSDFIIREPPE